MFTVTYYSDAGHRYRFLIDEADETAFVHGVLDEKVVTGELLALDASRIYARVQGIGRRRAERRADRAEAELARVQAENVRLWKRLRGQGWRRRWARFWRGVL